MAAEQHFGPIPPYGVAIREAMASGDSARQRTVIDAARTWLQDNPGHQKHGEVQAALREAEANG